VAAARAEAATAAAAASSSSAALDLAQKKLAVVAKEVKALRGGREGDEAARAAAVAAAADATAALARTEARVAALAADAAAVAAARDDAAARAGVLSDELRAVRAALADSAAARKRLEERVVALEADAPASTGPPRVILNSVPAGSRGGAGGGGSAAATSAARADLESKLAELGAGEWVLDSGSEPAPPVTIDSEVIAAVLQNYTPDASRQAEMWAWLKAVAGGKDVARLKPTRLELERAPKEVRDGFLAMVVPLLRARPDIAVTVQLRDRHEVRTDIRVSVEDRSRVMPPADKRSIVTQWRSNG
jgi:hypothetical protein